MVVRFYNNSSNSHVINKSISQLAELNVDLKEPTDIEKPEIFVGYDSTILKANYCYIPDFGRYYFCHANTGQNQTLRFICESDPLMSFRSAILSSPAIIARNPWRYNKYIHDNRLPIESRTIKSTFKFPNQGLFNGTHNTYILTTLGPGAGSGE